MQASQVQEFLQRVFAPGSPPGAAGNAPARDLDPVGRARIEYRLAELGYALAPEVVLREIGQGAKDIQPRAVLRDRILTIPAAAEGGSLHEPLLELDLPHLLIDRPACGGGGSPEEKAAARLAAAYLSLVRVYGSDGMAGLLGLGPGCSVGRQLDSLARLAGESSIPAVRRLLVPAAAPASILVQQVRSGRSLPGEAAGPALRVTPSTLGGLDLPPRAIEWVADHYDWVRTESGWQGGFLPLQVLSIVRGLPDRRRALYRSGVVAAPTSSGKTLVAELRMLARWFAPDARPKRTLFLVPTREIGAERAAVLRAAYGTTSAERRLRIVYSDGEHHSDDRLIREGRFDAAVLVNEKLRFFAHAPGFWEGLGEIVFDELETMGEPERGVFLEIALTAAVRAHSQLTVLGLTRPADGLDRVVRAMGPESFLLETARRPIPIDMGVWCPQTRSARFRNCNTGVEGEVPLDLGYPGDIRRTLRQLLVTYVRQTADERERGLRNNLVLAVPTKTDTMRLAGFLADLYVDVEEVREILEENSNTAFLPGRLEGIESTYRKTLLEHFLPRGIGFHDADLTREERLLVGQAFRDGEIAVLVCTRTMAKGINLPAQTIVFLNWSIRRGTGPGDDGGEPFYHSLEGELVTWLGRVGRFGKMRHRRATALYLCQHPPGSDEHDRITRCLAEQRGPFTAALASCASLDEAVLDAVSSLSRLTGRPPTREEVWEFLLATPSAVDETSRERLSARIDAALEELAGGRAVRIVEREGQRVFETTDLGRVAHEHGASRETCERLHAWLAEEAGSGSPRGWEVLDLFAVLLSTADGRRSAPLRPQRTRWQAIREEWAGYLQAAEVRQGEAWRERSPLVQPGITSVREMATLLALGCWRRGAPLYPDEGGEALSSIEVTYGLYNAGCSLHAQAREVSRLVRLLQAVAALLPENTFPPARPEELRPLSNGVVSVPHDLEDLADEMLFGLPAETLPLARLGVEGLSRAWTLALHRKAAERGIAPDLPLLERVKLLTEDESAFMDALPTHGLRERVKARLAAHTRQPVAECLRDDPALVARFYAHPFVAAAQAAQGAARSTAVRVVHRRLHTALRRNLEPGVPITIREPEEVAAWCAQGAVEFLAEVGRAAGEEYQIDHFVVELLPRNAYPADRLRTLAAEVLRRLSEHDWTDRSAVRLLWNGEGGFRIEAPFRGGAFRSVQSVRRALEALVHRLTDDLSIFAREQALAAPHVILDLTPVARRGVTRNAFSLSASTGGVCVPVDPARLEEFSPDAEAAPAAVLEVLARVDLAEAGGRIPLETLVLHYWSAAGRRTDESTPEPPLKGGTRPSATSGALRVGDRREDYPFPSLVRSPSQVEAMLGALDRSSRVALHFAAPGEDAEPRLMALAGEGGCFVVDLAEVRPEATLVRLGEKRLAGHDLAPAFGRLVGRAGIPPPAADDALLLSQLLHAGEAGETCRREGFHGLPALVERVLGVRLPPAPPPSSIPAQRVIEHAGATASLLLRLVDRLAAEIEAGGLERVARIERRCLPAVAWMAQAGVPLDRVAWEALSARAESEVERLRRELEAIAPPAPGYESGLGWNWDSPHSAREALRAAGCQVERSDDATLAGVEAPLAAALRRYRSWARLAGTYGRDWLDGLREGRVFPSWRQIGTATGRITCRDPYVIGIPRSGYREAVAAPPGRVLVRGDYSQLDLRIAAHLAGEERLVEAFWTGKDLHLRTARLLLGRREVGAEARQLAKALNYGFLYGAHAATFRRSVLAEYGIRLTEEEARRYRDAFFRAYPALRSWHEQAQRERSRESRTVCGRRRHMDEGAPEAVRLNAPVQGTAADGLKRALALLYERRGYCPGAVAVLAAHDEVLVECDADQADRAAVWLRSAMLDGMAPLIRPVPVEVRITVGATWGAACAGSPGLPEGVGVRVGVGVGEAGAAEGRGR